MCGSTEPLLPSDGGRAHANDDVIRVSHQPRPLPVASDGELVDVDEEGSLRLGKNAT